MDVYEGSRSPDMASASHFNFSSKISWIKEEGEELSGSERYLGDKDVVVCKVEKGYAASDDGESEDSRAEPVLQDEVVHSTERGRGRGGAVKKPLKDKICLVCGDRALGYNFNAVTCESCKAFFRRNAFRNIWGRCEGRCDISVESRSYCKRCRLKKCFDIGMKRDLILNERQKEERRQKILDNRSRRNSGSMGMSPNRLATSPGAYQTSIPSSGVRDGSSDESCSMQSGGPDQVVAATPVASSQSSCPSSSPTNIGQGASSMSSESNPGSNMRPGLAGLQGLSGLGDISLDPTQSHIIAGNIDPDRYGMLPKPEKELLGQVIRAFQLSFDSPVPSEKLHSNPTNSEFLNMADISVRRLVKMSKHLPRFKGLDAEDQVTLLKGAVLEVLVLRSVKLFDPKGQSWTLQNMGSYTITADKMQQLNSKSVKFMQQYQSFAKGVMTAIRRDNIILMLLMVLTVFSPDRPQLNNKDIVSEVQEEYAHLLEKYIRATYPRDRVMFARVIQKLADIRDLNEVHSSMLQNSTLNDLEPLIMEIFDITQQWQKPS